MKIAIASVLLAAMVLLVICIVKTAKEKHRLARTVNMVLIIGLAITFFNAVILLVENELVGVIAHCAYFVLADWILYYLLRFSMEYIGSDLVCHVDNSVIKLLLIADNISTLLNIPFRHMFNVEPRDMLGESYNMLIVTPFFFIHYGIIGTLITFILVSLIYRAVKSPVFYRRKYAVIAIILSAIVAVNIVCLFLPFDFSVIFFAVEGVCIYYCAFVYTPQRLLSTTLMKVSQEMSVALYVLDIDGNELYSNNYAQQLFSEDCPLTDRDGITIRDWCRTQYLDTSDEFTKSQTFSCGDEELILKIQLQRMLDYKKQLQGGYFVIQDSTEEYNKLKSERYLAAHDRLTGLYSKNAFCDMAQRSIKKNIDTPLLIVCSDIKGFKMINDFFSVEVGDSTLKNFADIIEHKLDGVLLTGRLDDDIFVLLIKKDSFDENVLYNAAQEAFTKSISRHTAFRVTNYLGIYEVNDVSTPVAVMCDRARLAAYSIKSDYRRRSAYYDSALRESIRHEQELVSDLDKALSEGQIKLYLQAITTSGGTIKGAEALVRWHHPTKGQLEPQQFMTLFEQNGLISEVNRHIWVLACKELSKWQNDGKYKLYITVNISPRDFYYFNLVEMFKRLTEKYQISPSCLKLEITRSEDPSDNKRQMETAKKLRAMGFEVWLDNFGKGQSSMDILNECCADVLKFDMEYVKKSDDITASRRNLELLLDLGKRMDTPLAAQGVTRQEQVDFLSENDVVLFQGDYFAKAVMAENFFD